MSILEKIDSTLGKWSIRWFCADVPSWLEWSVMPVLKLILNTQIFVKKLIGESK